MTETTLEIDPITASDIDARISCLAEAGHLYLLDAYKDTAIELITAARGKYDCTKSITENFIIAHVAIRREEFSQDLYRHMAPAV